MYMKKIWNDPVFSKVIASAIVAVFALLFTLLYEYFSLPLEDRSFFDIDFSDTFTFNKFIVTAVSIFFVIVVIWVMIARFMKSYDIFFSTPMSFSSEEEYVKHRNNCLKIIDVIKENTSYKKIYFAGQDITSRKSFSASNHAAIDDLKALRNSRRFILFMPKKMPTSAIFEAGYALRKNIPTVYLCVGNSSLPFLLRDLNQTFRVLTKYEGENVDQLCKYIKDSKGKLFQKHL